MAEPEMQKVCASGVAPRPAPWAPDLHSLIQSLLATLADFEVEYERGRETTISNTQDVGLRGRVLQKLKDRHEERRQPYIQQLALLQECVRHQSGLGS